LNIGEWIQKRAVIRPENVFLQDKDRVYNNRQFNERVNRTANALSHLGIAKGARVALLMPNCSEFLEIFFACAKIGAIMVPLNFRLAVPELLYIIQDAEPQALIYAAEFADKIQAFKTGGVSAKQYLRHGGDLLAEDPVFSDCIRHHLETEPELDERPDLKDPLFIMYTAGTTGDPKGAVLTHENILFGAIHSLLGYGVDRSYKSLIVAPLFHIGALAASVTPIVYAGGSLVISSFYSASEILNRICEEKINYMFAVPVMFQLMTEAEEWGRADLAQVHFFISGGAPIPLSVIRKYQEEKGVGFVQGYALTETGRLTSLDLEDSTRKAGSVGKEVFHVTLRIVDDLERDLPQNEAGEIIVKGPNVFQGYWRKEEATQAAMRGGWFHTGDMGRRDDDGFVYIIGRKVEMIISSGENIYPVEVERAIQSLPQVKEAAVVGMPDHKRGEVVAAFLMLHKDVQMEEEELLIALQGKIAQYKIPKKVFFVDNFPRNQAGKVLKRILKKRLETQ
jgi:fatty-acyl-CoA synthase